MTTAGGMIAQAGHTTVGANGAAGERCGLCSMATGSPRRRSYVTQITRSSRVCDFCHSFTQVKFQPPEPRRQDHLRHFSQISGKRHPRNGSRCPAGGRDEVRTGTSGGGAARRWDRDSAPETREPTSSGGRQAGTGRARCARCARTRREEPTGVSERSSRSP